MTIFLRERVLVALNVAVLLGSVAWALLRVGPSEAPSPPAATVSAPKEILVLPEVATEQLEAQPLFHQSRQPQQEAEGAQATAETPTQPQSLPVLLGVAGKDGHLGALLEDSATSTRQLVAVGSVFAGWSVEDVGARHVQLRNGKTSVVLSLRPGVPGTQSEGASSVIPIQ